jgi:hypothetical protein
VAAVIFAGLGIAALLHDGTAFSRLVS